MKLELPTLISVKRGLIESMCLDAVNSASEPPDRGDRHLRHKISAVGRDDLLSGQVRQHPPQRPDRARMQVRLRFLECQERTATLGRLKKRMEEHDDRETLSALAVAAKRDWHLILRCTAEGLERSSYGTRLVALSPPLTSPLHESWWSMRSMMWRQRFWTGQTHVVMEPLEFLRRIAALIPPARSHSIRYHGLFAAAAKDRANACALAPPTHEVEREPRPCGDSAVGPTTRSTTFATGDDRDDADPDPPYRKRRRMEWARLLRQVFAVDVLRCPCGGERKITAALTRNQSPDALRRYLEHLGEPADPPPTSPARAPPQTEFGFGAPADADPRSAAQSRDAVDVMPDWDAHIAD